jgi:hypothetical protein
VPVHACCIAFAVDATALERLLEDGDVGGYRDPEPWFVAADRLAAARAAGETFHALLASGTPLRLVRWAEVTEIEVHEIASTRETRVHFGRSGPVNPIFEALDSVTLLPAEYQLERERREGARVRRTHLEPALLHGYALCETPSFLAVARDG